MMFHNYFLSCSHFRLRLSLFILVIGKTKNKSRLIIGLSLGATAAVIIIVILLVLCIWRRKQNQARATAMDEMQSNEDTFGAEETETLAMDIIQSNEDIFGAEETETLQLPPMDFGLILRATENFSDANEIGHGGFGTVYKVQYYNPTFQSSLRVRSPNIRTSIFIPFVFRSLYQLTIDM